MFKFSLSARDHRTRFSLRVVGLISESESDRITKRLLPFSTSRGFLVDKHVDLDAFEPSTSTSFKPARGHVEVSCGLVSKTGKSDLGDRDTSGSRSASEPATTLPVNDAWSNE